ncbi:hypothetical protein BCR44DRAFT_365706 [Catenaria anguillulae PL171]|uniref:Uncharacterized protein n=1 Tax=Catenaria anguillulae PL171 TaxID=765915 RepID=A0A1Y2HS11_9FUNG|nr:hypothetical protein BCR44DRAFT_365706 [Catenaria anguillulae PL171]
MLTNTNKCSGGRRTAILQILRNESTLSSQAKPGASHWPPVCPPIHSFPFPADRTNHPRPPHPSTIHAQRRTLAVHRSPVPHHHRTLHSALCTLHSALWYSRTRTLKRAASCSVNLLIPDTSVRLVAQSPNRQ